MQVYKFNKTIASIATAVLIGLAGCSSGGNSSSGDTTVSGIAVDGYLQGANAVAGTQSTTTDVNGDFTFANALTDGDKIVISGGIDRSTGYPFEGRITSIYESGKAPIVSPLSTYVAALVDNNVSLADAKTQVAAALGIAVDELDKDPMTSAIAFLAAQKVQKTAEVLATALGSTDFNADYERVMTALAIATQASGDFNATALSAQVATDNGVTIDPVVDTFLETYVTTVDDFVASGVTVDSLDSIGEVLNTYTEVVEGALDANDTTAIVEYTTTLDALDANTTVTTIEDGTYSDPLVTALAEVENALDNNVSYLGTNTADNNITANLVLTSPTAAPFDTADLNLTWSTNNAVLSATGVITPAYIDTAVELKATVNNALASNFRTYNLVVKKMEVAPTAGDLNVSTNEDSAKVLDFTSVISDLNGDDIAITAVGSASHGNASLNGGVVTYTPALDFNGNDSFTYTVTDTTGRSSTGNVNITVNPVNDTTVWLTNPNLGDEIEDFVTPINITLEATDVDGNVTYSLVSTTAGISASISGSTLTINSVVNANGSQEIVVRASEGGVDSDLTLTLNILPVDDVAVWGTIAQPTAVDEDFASPVTVDLNATDVDSAVVYAIDSNNGVVNATISGSTLTLSAVQNANGTASIYVSANGIPQLISMVVNPINDAPVVSVNDLTLSVLINTSISGVLNASDVDGDILTFSNAVVTDGNITLNSDGSFTYDANSSAATVTFTYDVSDGTVTVAGTQTINVVLSNPPVAVDDYATTAETTSVTIDVLANDSDDVDTNAALSITSTYSSLNANLNVNADNTITYTPNTGFVGDDTFTYTIADSDGGEATATVFVTVTPANNLPQLADAQLTVVIGETITGQLAATDADGDTLTYSVDSSSDLTKLVGSSLSTDGSFSITGSAVGGGVIVIDVNDSVGITTVIYSVTVIGPQAWTNDYEATDGGSMSSAEYNALTAQAVPKDINLWSLWGFDTYSNAFNVSYLNFNSDNTLVISDDPTGTWTYSEDATTNELLAVRDGVDFAKVKYLATLDTPSAIAAELNVSMPSGAVVYKSAVSMLNEEYNFWGEAQDCTAGCTTFNSLQAVLDAGTAVQSEENYNRALLFVSGANVLDGSGVLMEADITSVYSGGEPVILNINAGTWSVVTSASVNNGSSDIIKITPNDTTKYQEKIYVLDDFGMDGNAATNVVYEGRYLPANVSALEYRFNDKALAVMENFTKIVTPAAYMASQTYVDINESDFINFTQVTDPTNMAISWFGIDYNGSDYNYTVGRAAFGTSTVDYTETVNDVVDSANSVTGLSFVYYADNNVTIDGGTTVLKIGAPMDPSILFSMTGLSIDSAAYLTAELNTDTGAATYGQEIYFDDDAMAVIRANFDNYYNVKRYTYEMVDNKTLYVISSTGDQLVLTFVNDGTSRTLYKTFGSFTQSYDPNITTYSIDTNGDLVLSDGTLYHISDVAVDRKSFSVDVTLSSGTSLQSTVYFNEGDAYSALSTP